MADINSKFEIGVTTGPIRGSRKVHVGAKSGSGVRVAMREIDLEGGVEKPAFVGIAMRVGVAEIRVGFLTKLGWIDVIAAAEQETIEAFEDLWTSIGRNPDRDSTGPLHGPGVVAVEDVDIDGAQHVKHIDQRRGRFLLARDADERLHVRKRTSAEGASVSRGSSATVHPCAALAG